MGVIVVRIIFGIVIVMEYTLRIDNCGGFVRRIDGGC